MNHYLILLLVCLSIGCKQKNDPAVIPRASGPDAGITISTDKARYLPNGRVTFTTNESVPSPARIRYKFLGETVAEEPVSGSTWQWCLPAEDFTGYMAELYIPREEKEEILATIAIDVSSDWTKFPRYGFLSKFPEMDAREMESVIQNLNRHHINGIQFYDWHYKHHQPLGGTPENPGWHDIINRPVSFNTVAQYIDIAHSHNMKAMFYNLIYGALEHAENDGVWPSWYLYSDADHQVKDKHPLPSPPFLSDIFLLNPANTGWQAYLAAENERVYDALPFDGFHMDQLGDRGKDLFTYEGTAINLRMTFKPFIMAMKGAHPEKALVMNAVGQYGQQQIALTPTAFLYTEVWEADRYADLANVILTGNTLSNHTKNTVLAAYMNYNLADGQGYFNTPAVLLTDAVIFAFGGAHLELGEHMLGKEYFPNDNLAMKNDLKEALVAYYDFLVAYQNLLRDGGEFNVPRLTGSGKINLNPWPPQQGGVSFIGKTVAGRQVIHLINFTNATTLSWRDQDGLQAYAEEIKDIRLSFTSGKAVNKVWYASPDADQGASRPLEFVQSGDQVSFTVPQLKYWSMILIE